MYRQVSGASDRSGGRSRSRSLTTRAKRSRSASSSRVAYRGRSRIYGMMSSPNTIYSFKRTVCAGLKLNPGSGFTTFINAAGVTGGYDSGIGSVSRGIAFQFSLQGFTIIGSGSSGYNMSGATEFTSLFDQWRIKKIVLKIMYNQNTASNTTPGTPLPIIQHCTDQDDANPPTLSTELLQRPEMKIVEYGSGSTSLIKYFTIYPNAKLASDPTGVTATTLTPRSCFFDVAESGVANFGFKMWFDSTRNASVDMGDLLIYADYYLDFKGVR